MTEAKERIPKLQKALVQRLFEFDRHELYPKDKENISESSVLRNYNICGDKALHMCILMAYKHPEKSRQREALLNVAKVLIERSHQNNLTQASDSLRKQGSAILHQNSLSKQGSANVRQGVLSKQGTGATNEQQIRCI
jgi:hypothetical protein